MADRFEQTAVEAREAIARARARGSAAHRRRLELETRVDALRGPAPDYGPMLTTRLREARVRLESARVSGARARERAERAVARRPTP